MGKIVVLSLVTLCVIHHVNADLMRILQNDPSSNLAMAFEWNDPEDKTTEADYYNMITDKGTGRHKRYTAGSSRVGFATETHSCERIQCVPHSLRSASGIGPDGLAAFYEKYTETYGIPVLGSRVVSDDAVRRACYVVRFLMADHSGIRQTFFRLSGRVAIMAASEVTTDIPEHAHMSEWWNKRARGLGATLSAPIATGAEENGLCFNSSNDHYWDEDIFLHEFSHGMQILGAKYAISGWVDELHSLYDTSKQSGLWADTYSLTSAAEYFAEGVQSYFEVNAYSEIPDGLHGPINTRAKLLSYDPELYNLIAQVFPCNNTYIKRCNKDRGAELSQTLKMNCDLGGAGVTTTANPSPLIVDWTDDCVECVDDDGSCEYWAGIGECDANPGYMLKFCKHSCNSC